jgi:hypothetical protein
MKRYYHFYSDGKYAAELFLSKSDYVAALNRLAVCALTFREVIVVAFTFEDTHFHLLLYCTEEEGRLLCAMFKKLTMMYISRTRNGKPAGLMIKFEAEPVEDPDRLKRLGAYVVVQPTKDGKGVMPYDYPWSSAPLYFRGAKSVWPWCVDRNGDVQATVRVGDLSFNEKRKHFKTAVSLPEEWLVCNGIILPSNYVDVKRFESIYGSHNAYRVYMAKAGGLDNNQRIDTTRGVSLSDYEMREACQKVCREVYGASGVRSLNALQRLEVARRLRFRYIVSVKQLARIVHVPIDELERFLERA